MMESRTVACVVLVPLACTLCLSVLFHRELASRVPHDFSNSSAWVHFAHDVSSTMQATNTLTRIALLLSLHTMHIFLCLPMLHITKVLYGYWLGILLGWCLCCGYELVLFRLYLQIIRKVAYGPIFTYTQEARATGTLFRENIFFAISSLPLQASAALVQFGDVSITEFMAANAIVTAVMSMKNVLCGSLLASSPTARQLLMLAILLSVSTILPTVSTVYVSSQTLLVALREHSGHEAEREAGEREKGEREACGDAEDTDKRDGLEPSHSP